MVTEQSGSKGWLTFEYDHSIGRSYHPTQMSRHQEIAEVCPESLLLTQKLDHRRCQTFPGLRDG